MSYYNSCQHNNLGEREIKFNSEHEVGSPLKMNCVNDPSDHTMSDTDISKIDGDSDISKKDDDTDKKEPKTEVVDSCLDDNYLSSEGGEELLLPSQKSLFTLSNETMFSDENNKSECSETLSSECERVQNISEFDDSLSTALKFISPSENHSKSVNGVVDEQYLKCGLDKVAREKKLHEMMVALEKNDIDALQKAAISPGGLLNDNIRRKVWPKLVGVDLVEASPRPCQKEIEEHPYYQQVVLDVNRSLKRFPPSIEEAQRLTMLDQLVILIMRVLCKHPELHYYQGYHDICVTFLLVLGEETAYHVVEKLSQTHLIVFMEKSMERTIHLLEHMFLLIGKKESSFREFLIQSEVGVAYCLSWLITWFSHVLNDYSTVVRFFDFFIVSHSWMPLYVTSSLVLYRQPEVVQEDCDMASVHSFLSKIPDDMPFEQLLTDSLTLFKSCKPKTLTKERPFVQKYKPKKITKKWEIIPKLKYVPTTIVIAAAVLVTAVIYQAFNY